MCVPQTHFVATIPYKLNIYRRYTSSKNDHIKLCFQYYFKTGGWNWPPAQGRVSPRIADQRKQSYTKYNNTIHAPYRIHMYMDWDYY